MDNPIVIDDQDGGADNLLSEHDPSTHELASLGGVVNGEISDEHRPKKKLHTQKQNTWCLHMWSEWATARNFNLSEGEKPVSNNFEDLSVEDIDYWLCRFVSEVRKKTGEIYPPNTVYQICYGLQRMLREHGHADIKLFEDPRFRNFQAAIESETKRFVASGDTQTKRQAQPITFEEENRLWELGLLGDHSPQVLVNTMVWQVGLYFALNSGDEQRNLRNYPSQITLVEPSDGRSYLVYKEDVQQGGWRKKPKEVVHYENMRDPSRCLIRLYKLYNSKCPHDRPSSAFYLQPLPKCSTKDSVWYSKNPIGHTPLRQLVGKMMKEAGFEGYYTSHSLKVSVPTRLLNEGIDEKVIQLIMSRTGHSNSKGVRIYKRTNEQNEEAIPTTTTYLNGCGIDYGNAVKRMRLQEEQSDNVEDSVLEEPEASVEDLVLEEPVENGFQESMNAYYAVEEASGSVEGSEKEARQDVSTQQDNSLQLMNVPSLSMPEGTVTTQQQVFNIAGGTATINNYFHNVAPDAALVESVPSQVFQITGGDATVNNYFNKNNEI